MPKASAGPARIVIPLNDDQRLLVMLDKAIERLKKHPKWSLVRLKRATLARLVLSSQIEPWVDREMENKAGTK